MAENDENDKHESRNANCCKNEATDDERDEFEAIEANDEPKSNHDGSIEVLEWAQGLPCLGADLHQSFFYVKWAGCIPTDFVIYVTVIVVCSIDAQLRVISTAASTVKPELEWPRSPRTWDFACLLHTFKSQSVSLELDDTVLDLLDSNQRRSIQRIILMAFRVVHESIGQRNIIAILIIALKLLIEFELYVYPSLSHRYIQRTVFIRCQLTSELAQIKLIVDFPVHQRIIF